ncbi:BCAS2 [Lepeophtheirus salmonis]|uniref:Pre-mRNA-splicing factor SPF27 n=1 Tax=Lepeophtheirus salmonis TaxID=72036 RepID=A0A7R8CE91_LEPSM|nr:BCAS2 [Lepeophtheirus salmonis]CAF2751000.1 BCAS2 [Lepeophtheirus salmonis]
MMNPVFERAALALVEEETRRYRPTKNYLEHLPPLNLTAFETEFLKAEFDRVSSRQPMDILSMKRYELPTPPPGKMTDVSAWTECVDNSMAQLEHQRTRICNLELMLDFGCIRLAKIKKEIQEINWARKNQQTRVGDKLKNLETQWVGLVSKNYEIETAIVELKN